MKAKVKRGIGLCMSAVLAAGLIGGCGAKGGEGKQSPADKEITTLTWYMSINPVAPDTDEVIAELNKYTRDKIGVEIDYKVIANQDYMEKMPNLINAGEYFDICFTSNWTTNYLQFAKKDAFLDISKLLPEYAEETYKLIPEALWDAVTIDGSIYGVPSYKELGWQGGILYNSDMAEEYGIDMSRVKTLDDYTEILHTVSEKSKTAGKDVIGIAGVTNGWKLSNPYEGLAGNVQLPAVAAVPEFDNFKDMSDETVFNQYASKEYMDYCKTVYGWNQAGYLGGDPVNYDSDTANRDNDFNNGALFSYFIQYAPGAAEALSKSSGHKVEFLPLMKPLFETNSALGGLLAVSSASEHPDKALEFINLLNTDEYVGTMIRHGIEGKHYETVDEKRIDKTMGGTLTENGYDYTYGWQFGTPFNQKWDISYPEDIEEQFRAYNEEAVISSHNGFSFNIVPVETQIAALTNVIAEYSPSLETGSVDPEKYIPKYLEALEANGEKSLREEVARQLEDFVNK